MREYLITKADVLDDCRLRLVFKGGDVRIVDLLPLVQIGGVFERFADRSYLRQVKIMCGGNYLEWPDELDIGADSLWHRGKSVSKVAPAVRPSRHKAPTDPVTKG